MKDYIKLYVQFLEMKSQHFRIDTSSVRDCLNRISDDFRNALNSEKCDAEELDKESRSLGVAKEHLESAVQAYFRWRKDLERASTQLNGLKAPEKLVLEDGIEYLRLRNSM